MDGRIGTILRALRWPAALAFSAATLLYVALWMIAVRYVPSVELGYNFSFHAQDQAQEITAVLPGSPAEAAGLRAGDVLLAIDGRRFVDQGFLYREWSSREPGDRVRLTYRRPGVAGVQDVIATLRLRRSRPSGEGPVGYLAAQIQNVYPLPFVLVGLTVLLLRRDDTHAWLLALMFAGFASTPAMPDSLPLFAPVLVPFAQVYQGLMIGLFGPCFYCLFAVFPARSPLDRRAPWLKWALLALGIASGLASIGSAGIRLPIPDRWLGTELTAQLPVWWLLGVLTLGGISLTLTYAWADNEQIRRKTRVVFGGIAIGLTPNVVIVGTTSLLGFREPGWLSAIRAVCAFLLPLSIAYAVAKHRVLDVPVLLRRGARYLLVQRGFTLMLAVVSIGVTLAFAFWFAPTLTPLGNRAEPVGIAVGAALGTLLVWGGLRIHQEGGTRIDRAFFRQAYDAEAILQALAASATTMTDRTELARLLEHHVREALQPTAIAVYLRDGRGRIVLMAGTWPSAPDGLEETSPWLDTTGHQATRLRGLPSPGGGTPADAPPSPDHVVAIVGRDVRPWGVIVLGARRSEEPYARNDADLLGIVARQAGLALENLSLAEEMANRLEAERRHTYELGIAQDVQQMLLPQRMPRVASLDYAGTCTQARVIGGDYYDYLDLGPGNLGFVIADISGKGIAAALLMANLQAMVRSHSRLAADDHETLLRSVNSLFHASIASNRFATMFFGRYDAAACSLTWVNSGHNPPLVLKADDRAEWLSPTATALGFSDTWTCSSTTTRLSPGDILALYSDGITEAWSPTGEEFGEAHLLETIRRHRQRPAATIVERVMAEVQAFSKPEQSDDWTLIVVKVVTTSAPCS